MKDDFATLPPTASKPSLSRGWESNASLEAIGQEYYDYRAQLMRESNKGLTKTYNRFHDPKERSPEIRRLRELHRRWTARSLAAYGWSDIDTTCGFDLDWCEAEAADDASPETLERLEKGNYFFESAEEARAFAVGAGRGRHQASLALSLASRGPRRGSRPAAALEQGASRDRAPRGPFAPCRY